MIHHSDKNESNQVLRKAKPYDVHEDTKHFEQMELERQGMEGEDETREEARATNNSRSVLHHLHSLHQSVTRSNASGKPAVVPVNYSFPSDWRENPTQRKGFQI